MNFGSDNHGPTHPKVMEALISANEGYAPSYGADAIMDRVRAKLREVFEVPEAAVYLVATGTAANSLLLATLSQPWQKIYCHAQSHVEMDECNGPEFYSGAKLALVTGDGAKMDARALRHAVKGTSEGDVHGAQRGPLSVTQVTERGTVYSLGELQALTGIVKQHGLAAHMDGARFANALVSLGCTPAEMTWKSGFDAVSFGGTKNGLMGVEAAIMFDRNDAWEFELRRKRGAHLFSKHRYLSAQMDAYLTDDLWLDMARAANASAHRLRSGLAALDHAEIQFTPTANMTYVSLPRGLHRRAVEGGASYYMTLDALAGGSEDDPIVCRLVTNWATTEAEVDRFVTLVRG